MNLLHNRFFTCFTEAGARALGEYAEEIAYNDGTIIFEEGDPSDCIFLSLEGKVRLSKEGNENKQVDIDVVEAGGYFGEMGVLDGSPRSTRATSQGATRLARIPSPPFLRILYQEPARASLFFFQELLGHLRKSNERIVRGTLREEELHLIGETVSTIVRGLRECNSLLKPLVERIEKRHQDAETQEACQQVVEQMNQAVMMVQDLLDFTCGRPVLKQRRLKISALLEEFKRLNKFLVEQPGVEVAVQSVDVEVNVDVDRMAHVLKSLVAYSLDTLETTESKVSVYAREAGDSVEICVQDNGPGIPEILQEHFFEPLVFRADRKGVGLDMAIVKKIVETHGGEIWFTTEANKETLFFIRLPKAKS